MIVRKRWGFGLGTFFSLIVIYFIYLYSKDKGWMLLALISKWYLIIVGGLVALSIGIVFLVILISFLILLFAMLKLASLNRKSKKSKRYIDAEYKVKE